ncbi:MULTISPECIES: hypothetical protein [Burkholderia]|uniref:Uncharacterized protein n=1 Tax=Burkholderia aenigmatica TaxID=2015348 RepID=A0A6J5JJW9_9BURK|nr:MULTISPECIES: hypothetical protein [Burkholderia]CAB3972336.1 hypothetical protein BLA3211_06917 [Burkholderia aenigmatica]
MNIECILHRKGGTVVEMPGKTYHFAPTQDDERHIAAVEVDGHIERFLSIREAYRIARSLGADADDSDATAILHGNMPPPIDKPPAVTVDPSQLKVAGAAFPPSFTIHGKTYSLNDVTLRAFQDSGLTLEDWNGLDDEHRATKTEIVLDALDAGEITLEAAPAQGELDERTLLTQQYQAKFGKLPPGNTKIETLKAKLAEGAA